MNVKSICLWMLLFAALPSAHAQGISQYEYWTDDDYDARSVVSATSGEISLDISTASLGAGLHFFNASRPVRYFINAFREKQCTPPSGAAAVHTKRFVSFS